MARDTARGRGASVLVLLLVLACCCVVAEDEVAGKQRSQPPVVADSNATQDSKKEPKMPEEDVVKIVGNETESTGVKMGEPLKLNPGAVLRAFYVFVGLSAIVVVYIVVRTVRLRRRKLTVRKYGILASRDDVEMAPLDREDDDEDTTLFDLTTSQGRQ